MIVEPISPNEQVILITGDRVWNDLETVVLIFSEFPPHTVIVHGYASGLDTVGDVVGRELGLRVVRCPAHWRHNERKCVETWGRCPIDCREVIGRPAGIIRNKMMYDSYNPIAVHGFHNNIIESRGTRDMLKYSMKRGTPTWLHTSNGLHTFNPLLTKPRTMRHTESVDSTDVFFSFD